MVDNREGDLKRQKEDVPKGNSQFVYSVDVIRRETEASSQTGNDGDYRESDPSSAPFVSHFRLFQERLDSFISKFTDVLQ